MCILYLLPIETEECPIIFGEAADKDTEAIKKG